MRVLLVSNEFPPVKSSGAVQVFDLAEGFSSAGHDITVVTATPGAGRAPTVERLGQLKVIRFPAFQSKDVNLIRRAAAEILTPLRIVWLLWRHDPLEGAYDGVVWYSPTIFLGVLIHLLKKRFRCKAYLILRDIFPDWAVHTGVMRRGIAYFFFKACEAYQYTVADCIGVQAPGNLKYLRRWSRPPKRKVEVLHNWLTHSGSVTSSLQISKTKLAGRKVFVYAGNMGPAQGIEILFELAKKMSFVDDVGFLFVGRGSVFEKYQRDSTFYRLENVLLEDFIPSDQIPDLYQQCFAGLLALDPRHVTHNIPGKFLSYMASGLPVLGSVNRGNDLINIVDQYKVGTIIENGSLDSLAGALMNMNASMICGKEDIRSNCYRVAEEMFSTQRAVKQISQHLCA